MNHQSSMCGNVLVIILIAIALIAGLTMTVLRSDVTDADSVTPEQAKVIASQIMAQARTLEQATQTLITKGCSEQTLNFENDVVGGYANADAPTDDTCDVFKRAGAGLSWPLPPGNANDGSAWRILAGNAIEGVTRTDDGICTSGCIDILAVLPNVTESVCIQLNLLARVTTTVTAPPVEESDFDGSTKMAGFNGTDLGEEVSDVGNILSGRKTGCFEPTNVDGAPAAGTYWFYHTLIAR